MNEQKTKAIIIDDEIMARVLLEGMLNEHCPDIEVVAMGNDLASGVKAIIKHKPNIVFLDIEMPGHSGLELLDFFDEKDVDFEIIFTTAYNQYAVEAFKLSAIGYILKPISADDLILVVERFQNSNEKRNLSVLKENLSQHSEKKIAIPTLTTTLFVPLSEIYYFKAVGAYSEVVLTNGKKITVSKGLKRFEIILQNQTGFFRCHKSFMINTAYIVEHIKSDGGFLKIKNGDLIPLSSERVVELYKSISWLL